VGTALAPEGLPVAEGSVGRVPRLALDGLRQSTVSEAIADAFENAKAVQMEGSQVVAGDIAGARYVSRGDARIVEKRRWPVAPQWAD
jgi:hypothetical protein